MHLVDLKPRWLGDRQGIAFLCPHCRKIWLTVYFAATPKKEQFRLCREAGICRLDEDGWPEGADDLVPCRPDFAWRITGGSTFEDLSIMPSLNASASGNWHGHVTNGAIVGGI